MRWRALRRLASQGHDHEREQIFFKNEMLALRGSVDRWRWPNMVRNGFGWFYQLFSDFGHSMFRPLAWWGATAIVFAALYLSPYMRAETDATFSGPGYMARQLVALTRSVGVSHIIDWPQYEGYASEVRVPLKGRTRVDGEPNLPCVAGDGTTDAFWAAVGLSVRKGLLFAGFDSSDKVAQLYACLYGINADPQKWPVAKIDSGDINMREPLNPRLPDQYSPKIPDRTGIFSIIQMLFSAVLIFLFLLALRNAFRIR